MPLSSRLDLDQTLATGEFNRILGTAENEQIDFKEKAYDLSGPKGNRDLIADVAAFAFFGGVPTKMAYDNTRIAVSRIVGGNERTLDGQVSQRQGVRGAAPVALHGVRPGERRSLL